MAERFDHEPDPLDALRAAWSELEPPAPDETSGADIGEADARTQAVVQWLRQAWSSLEVPAVEPGELLAHRRRGARSRPLRRIAAAAVMLLGLAVSLRLATGRGPTLDPDPRNTGKSGDPGQAAHRTESAHESGPLDAEPLRLAGLSSRHIELSSGPVRLILITNNPEPAGGAGKQRQGVDR